MSNDSDAAAAASSDPPRSEGRVASEGHDEIGADRPNPLEGGPKNAPDDADKKEAAGADEIPGKTGDADSKKNGSDRLDWKQSRVDELKAKGHKWKPAGQRGVRDKRNDKSYRPKYLHNRKKQEYADLPTSDDPLEIRRQVEFYFSDPNLSNDEHLFKLVEGSKNVPVPVKTIHTFSKMRRFQPYSKVVEALRDSKTLTLVDGRAPGDEKIVRKVAIKVPSREGEGEGEGKIDLNTAFARCRRQHQVESLDRSIYAKFHPSISHVKQHELEDLFRQYGSVMVRRRERQGKWRGSVFVEFASEEDQRQFLALEEMPEHEGEPLKVQSKREYCLGKCAEKDAKPFWEEVDANGEPSFTQQTDYEADKRQSTTKTPPKYGNKRKADSDFNDAERSPTKKKATKGILEDE